MNENKKPLYFILVMPPDRTATCILSCLSLFFSFLFLKYISTIVKGLRLVLLETSYEFWFNKVKNPPPVTN